MTGRGYLDGVVEEEDTTPPPKLAGSKRRADDDIDGQAEEKRLRYALYSFASLVRLNLLQVCLCSALYVPAIA